VDEELGEEIENIAVLRHEDLASDRAVELTLVVDVPRRLPRHAAIGRA
jgi:hypothetical protein